MCLKKAIRSVMVVSMTCTLNPGWCLFWACVTAQSEALIDDDTFFAPHPPTELDEVYPLKLCCLEPASQASMDRPLLEPTTPAQRASLLTSSLPLISWGQCKASPRLSLMPNSVWIAWVWTSCKGGSEMETRGRCVCVNVWSVVFVNLLY